MANRISRAEIETELATWQNEPIPPSSFCLRGKMLRQLLADRDLLKKYMVFVCSFEPDGFLNSEVSMEAECKFTKDELDELRKIWVMEL